MTPPDRSVPLRAVRTQAKCPVCGKPADGKSGAPSKDGTPAKAEPPKADAPAPKGKAASS